VSGDFCIKCETGFVLYCGRCVDAIRDELAALRDEIIRLRKERDKAAQVGARAMAGLAAAEVLVWETAYPTESYDQLRKRILKLTLPVESAAEGENRD